jgi:protein-disulfide isomerase
MNKRFLIILAVLVIAFGGFLVFSKSKKTANAPGTSGGSSQTTNHTEGAGNKGVTLTEYGDFQCPACGSYYPIVEEVRKKYGDDLKFEFRNFPLTQIHQNAMAAHRAAEAADKQGKFWDMYHVLYEQQQVWSASPNVSKIMEDFATQLGLDISRFKQDYQSEAVNNVINGDIKAGQAIGANSTPTFAINGKKVDPLPDRTVEAFTKLIDEAINKKQ